MDNINLIATATFGVEGIVAKELKELGFWDVKIGTGRVDFSGTLKDICRTNIWLRCADRVFLKIAEFKAETFDELFDQTKKLPWSDIIPRDAKFPVARVSSVKSKLFSKSDCQAIVKKAIVESMKKSYELQYLPETGEDYFIKIELLNDIATLSIDTSGQGLHKRGYRPIGSEAPIKETLAAALIKLSDWNENRALLDPTCGTGTILIEAAMMMKNIAPGGNRRFVSEKWPLIPKELWSDMRDDAYSREKTDVDCKIYGSDRDGRVLNTARDIIKLAGMENCIYVQKLPLSEISSKYDNGTIICNPPYGTRSADREDARKLYKEMGKVFKENFTTWSYYIITPDTDFENLFGTKSNKNRKLYNGGIKCYYYQYSSSFNL